MAEVYYWLLAHASLFGKTIYYSLRTQDQPVCTNPKLAMRWFEHEDALAYAARLQGDWVPVLTTFDGDAMAGA